MDCQYTSSTLYKIMDEFLIITCIKGIVIFSIKTKRLIQYYSNKCFSNKKKISCDDIRNIYILNNNQENISFHSISYRGYIMMKLEMNHKNGELKESSIVNNSFEGISYKKINGLTCLNNGNVFIWSLYGDIKIWKET